ncbi:hypothetical protein ACH3XW_4670 [Acanthocheilonema viteae]
MNKNSKTPLPFKASPPPIVGIFRVKLCCNIPDVIPAGPTLPYSEQCLWSDHVRHQLRDRTSRDQALKRWLRSIILCSWT